MVDDGGGIRVMVCYAVSHVKKCTRINIFKINPSFKPGYGNNRRVFDQKDGWSFNAKVCYCDVFAIDVQVVSRIDLIDGVGKIRGSVLIPLQGAQT